MSVSSNDFKNGMALNLPSEGLVTVVEFQHVKPGKGGAFVRTKLKKVAGGAVLERTFRGDEKVPLAVIDKREMQYLYREGDSLVFMDNESYDQLNVATNDLGSAVDFLKEGDTAVLHMYEGDGRRRRAPRRGRAHRHQHRARRAGRPRVGRPQAGDARDRPRRAGARCSSSRARRSRSTPAPGNTWRAPEPAWPSREAAAKLGSGPSASVTSSKSRDLGVDALLEQQPAPPDEYAVQLVRGVEEHSADVDARAAQVLRALGARAHARGRPRRAAPRRLRARVGARGPERGRDQRGGRAGQAVLHQGLRTVRQRAVEPHRRGAAAGGSNRLVTMPVEVQEPAIEEVTVTDKPWIVIVWNDPVNLMNYVVYVFQKLFGYSRKKATRLMKQVHEEGKAIVSDGTVEKCEADVARLHAHGLWATMEHPSVVGDR